MTAIATTLPVTQLMNNGKLSLLGKKWHLHTPDFRQTLALAQHFDVKELVAELLTNRGYTLDTAAAFLAPTIKELLPDPYHLLDMEKGVKRLYQAISTNEKVAVFGDYDVDGATSSALLRRYAQDIGLKFGLYIPDRIDEGYGPNAAALQKLYKDGYRVVIMVDCGTTAFEPLEAAAAIGLDIIVLDHHLSLATLPPTAALINPNRIDETSPLKTLCAAGLAFVFLVAFHRHIRLNGYFKDKAEPDLRQYLDLVALGTVCDVMPLTGLNRAFVSQGLKVMHRRNNLGIKALADLATVDDVPTAYHLGFVIGPRINAGGRVGKADLGSRLLTTTDTLEAQRIAQELDLFNRERQTIEALVLEQAMEEIERHNYHHNPVILVSGDNWHPGVIGIVAGRLKERYHRPACVVGYIDDLGKGSGRSINGVNLGAAMHQACSKGLLLHGGGHAMAAGFSVARDQYQAFYDFLNESLSSAVSAIEPTLELDAQLTVAGAIPELLQQLKRLEPYGSGNPTPRFCLKEVQIRYVEKVGLNHLRCQLLGADGSKIKGMAFRAVDTPLGDFLQKYSKTPVNVAGTLKLDNWLGRSEVVCFIDDIMQTY